MEIRLDTNRQTINGIETALVVHNDGEDIAVITQKGIVYAFFEVLKQTDGFKKINNSQLEALIKSLVTDLGDEQPQAPQIKVPAPPDVYKKKEKADAGVSRVVAQQMHLPILDDSKFPNGIELPEEGGILVHQVGYLYPQKGFPTPQGVSAANIAKRLLLNQVRMLSKSKLLLGAFILSYKQVLQTFLHEYARLVEVATQPYEPFFYMEERYMTKLALGIRRMIEVFFEELGIDGKEFAEVVSLCIQHDSAYYYRVEDILSETDGKKLYYRPQEEVNELLKTFLEREPKLSNQVKFKYFARLLNALLYIPKIKKAFQKAVKSIDFRDVQYDDADRYRVLPWDGYKFFGEPVESRRERFNLLHHGKLPPTIPVGEGFSEVI